MPSGQGEAPAEVLTLGDAIVAHFAFDDVALLVLELGISSDALGVEGFAREAWAAALVRECARQGRLAELRAACARARPDAADWASLPALATSQPDGKAPAPAAAQSVSTGGGAYFAGDVRAEHGDVIGRDKVVYGYTYEQAVALVAQIRRADQPEVWDGRAPYVGLAAFQEQDAALFFGRERLIAALVEQVRTSSSLAVFGPSGSGKSSVVRAGLIVALKRGALAGSDKWLVATMTPGNDPIGQLATALSAMALKAGLSPSLSDDLRANGARDATALAHLADLLTQDAPGRRLVVFVDQFEESFTLTRSDERRQAFFDLLTTAAGAEGGRAKVIVAARSDFLSQCAAYPELRRMINAQFRLIGAMAPEEMARAIALPALEVGASVQPELVAAVVNETKGDPGMLPLLQFALKDLFDALAPKAGEPVALTLDAYLARGGMRQVLERRANETFDALTPEQQGIARRVFAGLIEVGKGTVDTRRTARIAELVPEGVSQAEVLGVVQALSAGRLLTTMADQEAPSEGARGTVTLVHERLIDAWPWLRKLVDENRQAIERQNEIGDDATAWDNSKREASYLYAGARLQVTLDEVRDKRLVLSELSKVFLDAAVAEQARRDEAARREGQEKLAAAERLAEVQRARADEQAEARQRLRKRALALVVALVLAVGAAAMAVWLAGQAQTNATLAEQNAATAEAAQGTAVAEAQRASEQAAIANSRALAAQAVDNLDRAFDLSLLLATEVVNRTPSYETRSALLRTLQHSPRALQFAHAHTGSVHSVAFSSDGKTLVSGGADGTIRLWDLGEEGAPRPSGKPLNARTSSVWSVAFSSDAKTLVSGGADGVIRLWDVSNGGAPGLLGELLQDDTGPVYTVAFSPDGKTMVSGSSDSTIRLWDVSDARVSKPIGEPLRDHAGPVYSVAFSPDGKTLASGGADGAVVVFDVSDLRAPKRRSSPLRQHTDLVASVAFSPDGKTLASGSFDNMIILWDLSDAGVLKRLGAPLKDHTDSIESVAFSPDGKTLASGGFDNTIRLWDVSDVGAPKPLGDPLRAHGGPLYRVAFSPDGKTLASGSADNAIVLWDVRDVRAPKPLGISLKDQVGWVLGVAFSPAGKILASGSADRTIVLWDVSDVRAPSRLGNTLKDDSGLVASVAFSPDGKTLAGGGADRAIHLWDVTDVGAPKRLGTPLKDHAGPVYSVVFSPDGKILASGSDDATVILWDVSDARAPLRLGTPLKDHSGPVYTLAFSPDGKTLASGSADRTVILWDVSDARSPKRLGDPLKAHADSILSLAFSRDGRTLASGSGDRTVILWDVSKVRYPERLGEPIQAHTGSVLSVAFSPDGKTLASGSRDTTIILWDVSNAYAPKPLGDPLTAHTGDVNSVTFLADGRRLASGSSDRAVILWDIDPDSWTRRACHIAGRNMTRAEWARYMGDQPYRKTCAEWPEDPSPAPATPQPSGRAHGAEIATAFFVVMSLRLGRHAARERGAIALTEAAS